MIIQSKNQLYAISLIIYLFLSGCGTLGGIGDGVFFSVSKKKLEIAIDSLYVQHPEYKTPQNWEQYNSWSARGYDFLESHIFYFNSSPEEMYYVTIIGDDATFADTTKVQIGIRAINQGNDKWLLDADLDSKEEKRIQKRFNSEIVSKLNNILNQKH